MRTPLILKKAFIVLAESDKVEQYIPAVDEGIIIKEFKGSAPQESMANILLYWDYGGGSEELLWVITSDRPMPKELFFEFTGDGIKKIALVLTNGSAFDCPMSGLLELDTGR